MEQLRVRCPACQKLYQVESAYIYSESPHFECKACQSVFSFRYPVQDPNNVAAFLVKAKEEAPQSAESSADGTHTGSAPSETRPVILQAQPSLVQLWNTIFEDYDDHERHEDFVKRCQELDALSFAKIKYSDLRTALGSDPMCEKYLGQVEALLSVKSELVTNTKSQKGQKGLKGQSTQVDLVQVGSWFANRYGKKILYWICLLASLIMILRGFADPMYRNLIGVGMATGLLSFGLLTFIFGRIRLSDFIK